MSLCHQTNNCPQELFQYGKREDFSKACIKFSSIVNSVFPILHTAAVDGVLVCAVGRFVCRIFEVSGCEGDSSTKDLRCSRKTGVWDMPMDDTLIKPTRVIISGTR